ncbi:MoaD/ThiS family protein [Candidatus Bathyarchaeota archaeon]|nr:MoaD/ThiS family protein [Candidatus Bathyarchaeota archaeon]
MKVRVEYLGYIKNMLNKREEYYELEDNIHLSDLLDELATNHGSPFKKEVYEPGLKEIKTGFSITINGIFVDQLGGLDTELTDGDNILLMSLMSGG